MLDRRRFIQTAAAMGAAFAWGGAGPGLAHQVERAARTSSRGRRFGRPRSGQRHPVDPAPLSRGRAPASLTVEVAEDEAFRRVVAHAPAPVWPAADWTARVLVGGLKPARTYWYRFTDEEGNGSRIGRTITAPAADDPRPVNFAFVSCQDVNEGKLNGYRRMIFEDERKPASRAARLRAAPRRLHL